MRIFIIAGILILAASCIKTPGIPQPLDQGGTSDVSEDVWPETAELPVVLDAAGDVDVRASETDILEVLEGDDASIDLNLDLSETFDIEFVVDPDLDADVAEDDCYSCFEDVLDVGLEFPADVEVDVVFPPDCDDENICTDDRWDDAQLTCLHTANSLTCAASRCEVGTHFMTVNCSDGLCLAQVGVTCDDAITCTTDACDSIVGCIHNVQSGACLIAGVCFANEQLNPENACLTCSAWDSATEWTAEPDGKNCSVGKVCRSGSCVAAECGNETCPTVTGYTVSCNARHHCEYAYPDTTGWRRWDAWIRLPSGSFTIGSPLSEPGHQANEEPNLIVTFAKGLLIGKFEVTVLQYEACQSASPGTCSPPSTTDWGGADWGTNATTNGRSAHPQNGLTWAQANAVCTWMGGRLPSEAEWEFAATGPMHQKYPWGDTPEPACANNTAVFDDQGNGNLPWGCNDCATSGCSGTSPVGSRAVGASWSGALDMAGNVWEWVEDWYHPDYNGAPTDGSAWVLPISASRVQRGGGFNSAAWYLRSSVRDGVSPAYRHALFGTRCVRDEPVACAETICPVVPGYRAVCNVQQHCEYANRDATGWKQWDKWVYVPAGSFTMGSPSEESGYQGGEGPQHVVTFERGYLIGKYEVPVSAYEACQSGSPSTCKAPSGVDWDGDAWGTNTSMNGRSTHPQNGLTWSQADAVCTWMGGRLPSEAEWEYAATGPIHRKYPWGDLPEPTCSNNTAVFDDDGIYGRPWGCASCTSSGCSGTYPVGSKADGASWSGAMDMAGNVWEWVADWYHSNYIGAPSNGSAWIDPAGTDRVARGGSFPDSDILIRSARRGVDGPTSRNGFLGARCVRDLPSIDLRIGVTN